MDLTSMLEQDLEKNEFTLRALLHLWFDNLPYPAWIKEYNPLLGKFKMAHTNPAYEVVTGIARIDYVNNNDTSVWPEEVASAYEVNDNEVITNKRGAIYDEIVPPFHFYGPKWPIYKGNAIVAVAGMMKDLNGK